jgi:hypothetical protein
VTRNKLTFRDNLSLLLESASPTDRQLEKHFKEWLTACHRNYDRSVKFEVLCHPAAQVRAVDMCVHTKNMLVDALQGSCSLSCVVPHIHDMHLSQASHVVQAAV